MFLRIAKCQFVQVCSEIPDKEYELRDLDFKRDVSHACVIRTVQSHSWHLQTIENRAATCLQCTGKLLRMWEHGQLLFLHFSACCMNFKQPLRVFQDCQPPTTGRFGWVFKGMEAQPPTLLIWFIWTKWIAGTNGTFWLYDMQIPLQWRILEVRPSLTVTRVWAAYFHFSSRTLASSRASITLGELIWEVMFSQVWGEEKD